MFDAVKVKDACVQWIRDWFEENGKGCNAVLGISGGKDSSICAALCAEALGTDRVIGVTMPNGIQPDIDNSIKIAWLLNVSSDQGTYTVSPKTSKKEAEELNTKAEELQKSLRKTLKRSKLEVKLEKLKNKKVASMITISEETRRMQDMMKMYSMGQDTGDLFKDESVETLILNAGHPLVQKVLENPDSDTGKLIEQQLYDLALLSNKQLGPDEMTKFIQRSNDILMKL